MADRATCPVCGRDDVLVADGKLRGHFPDPEREKFHPICTGSHQEVTS